ncbi:MAG: DUF2207 domain-containing protein [Rhodanobacteraceae bacterium]
MSAYPLIRCLTVFTLLALAACTCHADERILDYHAGIAIAADASLSVTEHIRVRAEGDKIRHGIYRDFPTRYHDRLGNHYVVNFKIEGATRDGHAEDWHTEAQSNGVRIYLGNANVLVDSGDHDYTLSYRTERQMGFFADHDELYWNVTGNGWIFPIDQASAAIRLPRPVPMADLKAFGFTGSQGSQAHALNATVETSGARYATTHGLDSNQGLSVVLEFPKGIVTEPDIWQRARWFLRDNGAVLAGLIGLLILWLYYGIVWNRWGRDPEAGVVISLYQPPDGDSPAALRYVRRMGYDNTCFAAAVLGLAAKGRITINQDDAKVITLKRLPERASVSLQPEEKAIEAELFTYGDSIKLTQTVHEVMQRARSALQKALANGYEKKYFLTHSKTLLPGVAISLAAIAPGLALASVAAAIFMAFWLTIWSFGVYALASSAWQQSRAAHGVLSRAGSVAAWLFALPFIAGEIAGLIALGVILGPLTTAIFAALIGTNISFAHWMKAPTQDGAKLLDRINGFRWYLGVAEKQELDSRYRPESRPDLFSEYLPYALALDVEQAWAKRFADALSGTELEAARPSWYTGNVGSFSGAGLAGFTSAMSSSLSSAIASSSTSPGSSSGGGGGGSGGGGGGGGGGGW